LYNLANHAVYFSASVEPEADARACLGDHSRSITALPKAFLDESIIFNTRC
jgi:hypothetical protein